MARPEPSVPRGNLGVASKSITLSVDHREVITYYLLLPSICSKLIRPYHGEKHIKSLTWIILFQFHPLRAIKNAFLKKVGIVSWPVIVYPYDV